LSPNPVSLPVTTFPLIVASAAPLEFLPGQGRFAERVARLQRYGLVPDPIPADRENGSSTSRTSTAGVSVHGPAPVDSGP